MARPLGSVLQPVLGFTNWSLSGLKPNPKLTVSPAQDAVTPEPATLESELLATLQRLDSRKDAWAALANRDKAALLRACLRATAEVSREAAETATQVKGSWGNGIAEEHIAWVPLVSGLREYAEALEADCAPRVAGVRVAPNDNTQQIVDVFPTGLEALLFGGWSGEVWLEPGKVVTQGELGKQRSGKGEVALVLGAGNQTPVAPLDILHKLVAENAVVVCKMNPVNEYMGPYIRQALAPLVDEGYVMIVYGGGKEGAFLCNHPLVGSILLTGSAATYDAIVWGADKQKKKKALDKRVDGELGCVTPYIITPGGTWSQSDLDYHAAQVATGLSHNAGHNCLAAEIVVTAAAWPQREAFLTSLRKKLAELAPRKAYYPGSAAKLEGFCKAFPDAEQIGSGGDGAEPWRLQTGLTPNQAVTDVENWCGVLQEVALPGEDLSNPSVFLPAATAFANDHCSGNLSCSLFVHPQVEKRHSAAVDTAVGVLRYGSVCFNVSSMMGFCITRLSWGAFPENTPEDIKSGNCWTHNTMLLDNVQKSVLRAPWRSHPTPFWSPFARNAESVAPKAITFMAAPSLVAMTPLSIAALLC